MTTDHEAAAIGKVGALDRFVDWLTYDPHSALGKASERIAYLRTQVLGEKANREVAEKGRDEAKERITFLEGELKQTADKLHAYIQDKRSFGLMAQERDQWVAKNQASEATITELKKQIQGLETKVKYSSNTLNSLLTLATAWKSNTEHDEPVAEIEEDDDDFDDIDDEEDDDDDEFDDDDEETCEDCGQTLDECEC